MTVKTPSSGHVRMTDSAEIITTAPTQNLEDRTGLPPAPRIRCQTARYCDEAFPELPRCEQADPAMGHEVPRLLGLQRAGPCRE